MPSVKQLQRELDDLRRQLREANRRLQETNQELGAICDAVVDGLIIVEVPTGKCVRANSKMADMLGYTLEELPKDAAAVHRPEDMPRLAELFRKQIDGELPLVENVPFLHKNGGDVYTDVSGVPMTYNQTPCLVCLVRDVTRRRKVEQSLRESEARYRGVVEASPDAVVMIDLDGNFLFASRQTWSLLGLPPGADLSGRSVFEFVAEPELEANLHDLVEKGIRRDTRYTVIRPDGTPVPIEVSSAVVEDDREEPVVLMAVVRDVTERHRTQEARRQSEERFRAIFDEAPVGMVIGNPDQTIARVNKALCEMTGYTPEEMIGKSVQAFMHPDDVQISAPLVEKLLAGEIPSFSVERRYLAKDGRPFWAQATTATIRGSDGRLTFGLGILQNIEERRRAQEAVERERKTLWHMLRSSDHERRLIAYDIHDGLAQQLAAASMQFQTYEHLKDREPASARTAFDAGVQMLRQAHSEARRLISGVRPPVLDESGIVAALAHLAHDQTQAGCPDVEFQSHVKFARLEPVLENAVYRIAQEALANACKHSRSDRVKLLVEQNGESLHLVVEDWGVGFDPNSVDENQFGLDGIRERARLLGGRVRIESQLGVGTTIDVVLPLLPAGGVGA